MNLEEAAAVIAKAAAFDNREPTDAGIRAWHEALQFEPVNYALEAVTRHYQTTQKFIMPADILRYCDDIRRETVRELRAIETAAAQREWESRRARQLSMGGPDSFKAALAADTTCLPAEALDPGEWNRRVALHRGNNPGKREVPDRLDTAGRGPEAAAAVEAIRRTLPTGQPLNRAARRRRTP